MSNIALLIFPTFSDFEITVATAILHHNHRVVTFALDDNLIVSEAGLQYQPHLTIEHLVPDEHKALIIPGATDMTSVMDAPTVHSLIQVMDQQRKLIAAICGGPIVLAKAGILVNRLYTVSLYRQHRDHLGCFDETGFRQEAIVASDHILTAHGYAFVEFGLQIGKRLNAIKDEEAVTAYYHGQGDIRWEENEKSKNRL